MIYFISKLQFIPLILLGNVFFTYCCFRTNLYFRAWRGASHLSELNSQKKITWTKSQEFEDHLKAVSDTVSIQLESEFGEKNVWRYAPNTDLHDQVLTSLEKDSLIYELPKNYQRARIQQMFKPNVESL